MNLELPTGFPQRSGIPVRTGMVLEFQKVMEKYWKSTGFLKGTGKCT